MKYVQHALCGLACALAMGNCAYAGLATFDNPSLIDVNSPAEVYTESGIRLSADFTSYLPLDGIGSAGTPGIYVFASSPVSLTADGGGLFRLLSLDYGRDSFDPAAAGTLTVRGVLDDNSVLQELLALGDLTNFSFQGWTALKEVTIFADANFALDNVNISAVPEPASLALVGVALAGMLLVRTRRSQPETRVALVRL